MKSLFALALIATLFVGAALASNGAHPIVGPSEITSTDALCELIGRTSGCSGCVLGTKNLCRWTAQNVVALPFRRRNVLDAADSEALDVEERVRYTCLSRETAEVEVLTGAVYDASHLCPANPAREQIIRNALARSSDTILEPMQQTSTFNTTFHTDRFIDFPFTPYPVDRTSFHEQAGYVKTTSVSISRALTFDCARLSDGDRAFGGCGLFQGFVSTERDRFCLRTLLDAAVTTRCPAYGKAVSGITIGFMKKIWKNCFGSNIIPSHYSDPEYDAIAAPFFGLRIVSDDTPFAISDFELHASGELLNLYGYNSKKSFAFPFCD